jgi:hypothetical protein
VAVSTATFRPAPPAKSARRTGSSVLAARGFNRTLNATFRTPVSATTGTSIVSGCSPSGVHTREYRSERHLSY